MKVRPTIPGAVIRFPNEPRRRLSDEGDEVPETGEDSLYWHRLLRSKEIEHVRDTPVLEPAGREPLTPITTR